MINRSEILQTIAMIDQQHLDIRTITMGISLLDCADTDIDRSCTKVYDKICRLAGNLVRTGEDIEAEFGIPIVNKRVSVTPISLVAAGTGAQLQGGQGRGVVDVDGRARDDVGRGVEVAPVGVGEQGRTAQLGHVHLAPHG